MESLYKDKRVLQDFVTSSNKVSEHDATIIFLVSEQYSSREAKEVTYHFHTTLSYIIRVHGYDVDSFISKIYYSSFANSFSKNMTYGEDGNYNYYLGDASRKRKNLVYIPNNEIAEIKKISCNTLVSGTSATSPGLNPNSEFYLLKNFPNLKEVDFYSNGAGYLINTEFLTKTPNIKILRISGNVDENFKNSSVKYLQIRSADIQKLNENIPYGIEYLDLSYSIQNPIKLNKIYQGTCKSVVISKTNANAAYEIDYDGGALFPSVISNTDSDFTLGAIFSVSANIASGNMKTNPDNVSQFLIDFANQVTSVDLPTAQKLIRLRGLTPNTSYEDFSQPLFTTYASALAHITGTLGITVQFT